MEAWLISNGFGRSRKALCYTAGVDPAIKFFDSDGSGFWDGGEDIVYDANLNGVFD